MVRISTEEVKHFAEAYVDKINVSDVDRQLDNLLNIVANSSPHVNYVKKLKALNKRELITAVPSKFEALIKEFNKLGTDVAAKFGTKATPFHKLISDALGYDKARSIYRSYVSKMGIRTCMYCNAQYAITFEIYNGKEYAQFEIDHWKSKSLYPFLAISFYNFVPSCSCCNKHKGNNDLKYSMYSEKPRSQAGDEYDPFVFVITDESLAKYLNGFNTEKIQLEFISRSNNTAEEQDYARFAIKEMYNLFNEEAALVIKRYLFYSHSYQEQMKQNYSSLFGDHETFDEFVFGVPLSRNKVPNRPLAKLTQDIRKQLGQLLY